MKNYVHLWSYLSEWEKFQTNIAENIKTHIV